MSDKPILSLKLAGEGAFEAGEWRYFDGTHLLPSGQTALAVRLRVDWRDRPINSAPEAILAIPETMSDFNALTTGQLPGESLVLLVARTGVERMRLLLPDGTTLELRVRLSPNTNTHFAITYICPHQCDGLDIPVELVGARGYIFGRSSLHLPRTAPS